MRLVDVLPNGTHKDMPDGKTTASARQQAFSSVEYTCVDGRTKIAKTIGHVD